jgi:hypothetical protein
MQQIDFLIEFIIGIIIALVKSLEELLCPNCDRPGQILPDSSKRNQKLSDKFRTTDESKNRIQQKFQKSRQ